MIMIKAGQLARGAGARSLIRDEVVWLALRGGLHKVDALYM